MPKNNLFFSIFSTPNGTCPCSVQAFQYSKTAQGNPLAGEWFSVQCILRSDHDVTELFPIPLSPKRKTSSWLHTTQSSISQNP